MYELVDFTNCPLSQRHGSYAGNAGGKRGIVFEGEPWIVKYPKTTKSVRGDKLPSYTSSPLSEYLGSHVYALLGVDVHETLLGIDGDKIVVACKDFRPDNGILKDFRSVKNAMTPELNDLFDRDVAVSATGDRVDLDETLFHMSHNPMCKAPEIEQRLADMIVIDALIDNNDRNNGNWALMSVGDSQALAPVFDNGNSFSNKVDDDHLEMDVEAIASKWASGRSIYEREGHQLSNSRLFSQPDIPNLAATVERHLNAYYRREDAIRALVNELPETHCGLPVCSEKRKACYLAGMEARARWLAQDFQLLFGQRD